jgi:hypothetical protein
MQGDDEELSEDEEYEDENFGDEEYEELVSQCPPYDNLT